MDVNWVVWKAFGVGVLIGVAIASLLWALVVIWVTKRKRRVWRHKQVSDRKFVR